MTNFHFWKMVFISTQFYPYSTCLDTYLVNYLNNPSPNFNFRYLFAKFRHTSKKVLSPDYEQLKYNKRRSLDMRPSFTTFISNRFSYLVQLNRTYRLFDDKLHLYLLKLRWWKQKTRVQAYPFVRQLLRSPLVLS